MSRPRTNDPLGIPKKPNPTTDPDRLGERMGEFEKRIDYLTQSYQIANYALKNDKAFNESLARLKRSLNRKRKAKHRGERLHPEVEMVISTFAREIVNGDETRIDQQVIEQAAWQAVEVLKLRRRPANRILRHHVAGVMALVHSFSGKPVLARRYRDMDDCQRRLDSRPVWRSKSRPVMAWAGYMQRAPIGALCKSLPLSRIRRW